ncbi:MAG: NUDIX domain-containing protein [Patescibacteria group bacterium]|jgi:isopentenyldiphosphate isomerase
MSQLNLVNENDEVIGQDSRENIHRLGLLHREVHVWLYNREGKILFQKRGQDKDTFPGLLDASAGGHVEIGESYSQAAIKELREETGVVALPEQLVNLGKVRKTASDPVTGTTNNVFRQIYAYLYSGRAEDLKLETGEATSLEFWPIEKILSLSAEEKKISVPGIFTPEYLDIFQKLKNLIR